MSEGLTLYGRLGAYKGDYIHDWLHRELRRLGVVTFGDLRRMDGGDDEHLSAEQRYSLVVMATDVTRGRLLRLPWDYHLFGLDPDAQFVADAVRMSLSIPLFFEPCSLTNAVTGETSVIVDGGVLSNFAVDAFDRTDGKKPRWPTFGVRLLPDLPAGNAHVFPALAMPLVPPLRLVEQVLTTALVGRDQTHLDRPGVRERTMIIDTSGVGITDSRLEEERRQKLLRQGRDARNSASSSARSCVYSHPPKSPDDSGTFRACQAPYSARRDGGTRADPPRWPGRVTDACTARRTA